MTEMRFRELRQLPFQRGYRHGFTVGWVFGALAVVVVWWLW